MGYSPDDGAGFRAGEEGRQAMGKDGNKTVETNADVAAFLSAVEPSERRADAAQVAALVGRHGEDNSLNLL